MAAKANKQTLCASLGACEGGECLKCAICLDTCTGAVTTGCGTCQASFHATCLDSWVALKIDKGRDGTCPACRAVLVRGKDGDQMDASTTHKSSSSTELLPATSSASHWFYDDDDTDYDEEAAMQSRILNQRDMFGNTHWDGDLANVDSCEWDYPDSDAVGDYGYDYAIDNDDW